LTEFDETLERAIDTLRQPVDIDSSFDGRVMSAIAELPRPERKSLWLTPRWTIRLSPLGGLATAAAITALIIATTFLTRRDPTAPPVAAAPHGSAPVVVTQFVLVAPNADSVMLVGDFNDWDLSSTKLVRQKGDGVWWVTVVLPPGRYRYAFVVDGKTWRSDPGSPAAEDEFGRPNSVITVGET